MSGVLFVVTAASGTGKTSLVKALLEQDRQINLSVSHTTRHSRPGEVDGVHYHFTDKPTFERMIDDNAFIEHAEVFGHFYGTSVRTVSEKLEAGQDVLLEIDWQGAAQVKKLFPHCVQIFILPPSKEALKERLVGRAQDSDAVIQHRLDGAVLEMQQCQYFDYIVINDVFDEALLDIQHIVSASRLAKSIQLQRQQTLIQSLITP